MLKSCDDLILILNNSRNKKIGFIQISFNKKVFFLSILIDKKYQNNGFATIVIDILKKVYSKKYNLRAVIHEDNKPSLSLFKKNGFSKIKHLNNKFYIYEYKY